MFKMKINAVFITPEVMKNIFGIVKNPYSLKNKAKFKSRIVRNVRPRIWNNIQSKVKKSSSLEHGFCPPPLIIMGDVICGGLTSMGGSNIYYYTFIIYLFRKSQHPEN